MVHFLLLFNLRGYVSNDYLISYASDDCDEVKGVPRVHEVALPFPRMRRAQNIKLLAAQGDAVWLLFSE